MRKVSKLLSCICLSLSVLICGPAINIYASEQTTPNAQEIPQPTALLPGPSPVDLAVVDFFSNSAFIGNSIGVGLTNYVKRLDPNYIGTPTMLTVGCYSFRNDSAGNPKYMVSYNKTPLRAKDAVAASGAKYVFINMGTNDLFEGTEKAYTRYVNYIDEIRQTNPGVVFFIESTTPACKGSNVSNDKINRFNELMYQYCLTTYDTIYIDISTPMKDAEGYLQKELSSDKSVHLNNKAYEMWMDTVRNMAVNLILASGQ